MTILTVTVYNPITGDLGAIYSGTLEDISPQIGGRAYLEGAFSNATQYYDVATGTIKERLVKPELVDLRAQRDHLLDSYRWTIMPDSPLSEPNKEEWLLYLKSLHSLLLGVTPNTTDTVIWPEQPSYIYA